MLISFLDFVNHKFSSEYKEIKNETQVVLRNGK